MTAGIAVPMEVAGHDCESKENLRLAAEVGRVRTELLSAFLEQMNATGLSYCLLNGFRAYPEVIASDVDFMVRPEDAERVAPLLREVARQCDALLVQGIRHETGATYFVLAKQMGTEVAYLHPDCTTDYRREGRLWLEAESVLRGRRQYKSFFVPAIADEFLYYLTKKVLKQQITLEHVRRLAALYLSCPEECSDGVRRFWTEETVRAMVAALLRHDAGWIRRHMAKLLSELRASDPVESWWKRVQQYGREWRRRFERVIRPAGLGLSVVGGTAKQRDGLAQTLDENLRPAFRRTMTRDEGINAGGPGGGAADWLAKVRSTLVIRKSGRTENISPARDELSFVLPQERDVEYAIRVTLEYLAERLERRMRRDRVALASTRG
jgi:hypothetical protein